MALTTINSGGVKDDSIVNADIKSDAAIAGSKINPAFTTAASITAAQPQLQFQDSDGTNQITEVSNSSGHTYIKTRNNTSGGNFYVNTWDNTNSNYPTLFTILNGGNVGIGTTSPTEKLHAIGQVGGTNPTAGSKWDIARFVAHDYSPTNSGGLTIGAYWNNSDVSGRKAYIQSSQNTDSGSTVRELVLNPDGGDVSIGDGNLVVANGHGVDFSASGGPQGAALGSGENELLDDYEHGFFTPTISGSTTAGDNISYVTQVGTYIKVGTLVNVSLVLMVNDIDNAAGDLKIHGFPFVHKAGSDSTAAIQYNSIGSGLPAGREGPAMAILQGGYSTILQIRVNDSGTSAYSALAVQTLTYMRLSLTYFA